MFRSAPVASEYSVHMENAELFGTEAIYYLGCRRPTGPFYLLLRNYAPVPEAVEALRNPEAFPMPPIVPEAGR